MRAKKILSLILGILLLFLSTGSGNATTPDTGEEALFTTSVAPDAMILLDLSGSMDWNPAGGGDIYGNASCSGTFYSSSGSGHNVNCSRLAIAKRSIFDILDDNDDNRINSSDEGSLGVRLGYMNYFNCGSDDTGNDYTSGCIQIPGSGGSRRYINSKYSQIYCNSNSSCTVGSTGSNSVGGASASGGTPLASALGEARTYLNAHKAADSAGACRQKFVILVTDGSDTYACGASGAECASHRYKNRRESVARAKALADAGYRVFVIGFGAAMPPYLQNTLNWMAYYGRTDNPSAANAGSTAGYSIASGCDVSTSPVTNPTACCDMSTNPTACFPTGVTSCLTDSAAVTEACYDSTNPYPGAGNSTASFRASANDPGYLDLSGYAFLAADADQLATALKTAMNLIREATYSFSQASIQSTRTQDENFVYEGSFQPVTGDPFWLGHLKKYQINSNGTVGSVLWDAGTILQSTAASSRTIKTYKAGSLVDFTTANITASDLGVSTTAQRDAVVGYFRGESAYNPDNWKLGDVFRSTPITVGTPSAFYDDMRDATNQFAVHRSNHVRTSVKGNRLITAGANDGQMHAFRTSDGTEAWSFIPPNLLPKLKSIAHATEPTSLTHLYYVDGPVTVADVWLGSGDGTSKSASDWKTQMIFGEGRGPGTTYLWSSSQHCDSGFSASGTYNASYPHYCGYYAFDITGSSCTAASGSCTAPQPSYMWRLGGTAGISATHGPYLAEPWSKFMIGKILINGHEKWAGFVGGGGSTDNSKGNVFFVVDLADGTILWGFTHDDNAAMDYGLVATPAVVDTDLDGFVDTVYVGDRGDNMWRFKLCRRSDGNSCNTGNWTGGLLFDSSSGGNIRPIFTIAAVARDASNNLWVYFGTGDKNDPTAPNAQEKFVALKDNDRTTTYAYGNLENITSTGSTYSGTGDGWYINMTGQGEKILADPTVFGGVVYFTTYTPPIGNDPCAQGGAAKLYGVNYTTGAGEITTSGDRSMSIGTGIASAPILSMPPGSATTPDLYVTTSGGGGIGANTARVNINPPSSANRNNMLYWRDLRVQ
jgi:hypothetical protein